MSNSDLQAAWRYHNSTKHSYWSIRNNPHFLDWANQPLPFKIYPTVDLIPLPRDFSPTRLASLNALAAMPSRETGSPNLQSVGDLLFFSAGVTRQRSYPGGEIYFRAAACTGALYEIELYLVCGPLADLEAGVYHFAAGEFGLRKLRSGDFRDVVVKATGKEPSVAHAPVLIICTGTYWRNAWKYQARTYRHFGWDNGTILANMLAMCAALGLPAKIVCGFVDAEINRLLGLDTKREVSFSLVAVGHTASVPGAAPDIAPLALETLPVSAKEVDYPAMRDMHAASSLVTTNEVETWRASRVDSRGEGVAADAIPLRPIPESQLPRDPIESVILRRGSTRRFSHQPITFEQLSTILDCSTRRIAADFLEPPGTQLNHLYIIANAVDELRQGAYYFDREHRSLALLKEGNFRSQAGYLGLEQALPADASAAIFFLADLPAILAAFGNRGYRATQLEAGIIGGKIYVSAYALGLGATGLTFYDDDVVSFFSPHAAGESAIFLMAIGRRSSPNIVGSGA